MDCSFENCSRPARRRGWCGAHYQRWYRYGDPKLTSAALRDPVAIFWSRVDQSGECWIWQRGKLPAGYGVYTVDQTRWLTHRYAYMLTYGAIPEGGLIDHVCHTPSCVRPDHLRLSDQKQNQENRKPRDRPRGVSYNGYGWVANVCHQGVNLYLGTFRTEVQAVEVARQTRLKLYTHNDADR